MRYIEFLAVVLCCIGLITCSINWNGNNWAFGCDFTGNDLSDAKVPGEKCSEKCAQTSGCTHYSWTSYNGGTCWMKKGSVSKNDAVTSWNPDMVCGILGTNINRIFKQNFRIILFSHCCCYLNLPLFRFWF